MFAPFFSRVNPKFGHFSLFLTRFSEKNDVRTLFLCDKRLKMRYLMLSLIKKAKYNYG